MENGAIEDVDIQRNPLGDSQSIHDWEELESIVTCRNCEAETAHQTSFNRDGRFEPTCTQCATSFTL